MDDAIHVVRARLDGGEESVRLPYPREGVGGVELVVSGDERWVAVFVFSGQSEQGWELFALEPVLGLASRRPYEQGEGRAPRFSPDSRWLVMAMTASPKERGSGRDAEDILGRGVTGQVLLEWATLYLHALLDGSTTSAEEHGSDRERWCMRRTCAVPFGLDEYAP